MLVGLGLGLGEGKGKLNEVEVLGSWESKHKSAVGSSVGLQ